MATIRDIAKICNVSVATVSNIINGKGGASEETAARVRKVADELNFAPNMIAKNLKQRSTRTIGVLTEDLTVFNMPEIVDGIDSYYEEKKYHVLLSNLRLFRKYGDAYYESEEYFSQVAEELKIMLAKQVEGIIYIGCQVRNIPCIPKKFPIPIVVAYSYTENKGVPSVVFNDEQAAYDATKELIGCGHKRIAILCGPANNLHTQQRLQGYQRALFENEILFNPAFVLPGGWTYQAGYEAAERLFQLGVTAVFAMNDLLAGGVLDRAKERGIRVGEDLSIIGFDNREISKVYNPPLTTVQLPLTEIGREAASLMLDLICKNEEVQLTRHKMNCSLVRRASVSAPKPAD